MKNNNMDNEKLTDIPCGVTLMPMKEVYQMMYDDVACAHVSLVNADSAKTIRHILREIYEYPVDNRVSAEIQNMIADIKGNVHTMRMYDYTRSEMCHDIEALLTALINAIEEEKNNEILDDCRRFFTFMVDHSEDFMKWVDQMTKKQ